MQKNDIIELKIEDMGVDGEGIGKYDGMTFFVKDAVLGDEIEARITKMKKNYGYARVEQILSPSKFRVTPQCELHRRCGGCQIQRWIMKSSWNLSRTKCAILVSVQMEFCTDRLWKIKKLKYEFLIRMEVKLKKAAMASGFFQDI